MNILLLGSRMDLISGHSRPAYELAAGLERAGQHVRILSDELTSDRLGRHHRQLGAIETGPPPAGERIIPGRRGWLPPSRAVRRELSEAVAWADVVHGFSLWGSGRWLQWAEVRKPAVLTINTYPRSTLADFVSFGRIRLGALVRPASLWGLMAGRQSMIRATKPYARLLSWTDFLRNEYIAIGVDAGRIDLVRPGLDFTRLPWRPPTSAAGPTILFMGGLAPARGPETVLRAFSELRTRLPDATLVIANRGHHVRSDQAYMNGELRRLKRYVVRQRLAERVIIRGFEDNVAELIGRADVVVLPFNTPFGYSHPPLTVLESLAVGRPVVSTPVGSVAEIIDDPRLGSVVPPNDPQALAQAVVDLWRGDSEQASRTRRAIMRQRHDWESATSRVIRIYQETVDHQAV